MSFPTTRPSLLSHMRRGDDDAWTDFYRAYTQPALAYLCWRGLDEGHAEDVWQECCINLAEGDLNWYRRVAGSRFSSWLAAILNRLFMDWLNWRSAQKRGGGVTDSGDEPVSPDDPSGPSRFDQLEARVREEDEALTRRLVQAMDHLLREYPDPRQSDVFRAWYSAKLYGDSTDDQIATRLRLRPDKLKYIREKVERYLRRRWWGHWRRSESL